MASLDHSGSKMIMSTVILHTDRYVLVLHKFWTALGRWKEVVSGSNVTVPPHTPKDSLTWLKKSFSDGLNSRKYDPLCSPYSSDLNPKIIISGDICVYPQSAKNSGIENRNYSNNKSDPKGGMRGHTEFYPQDSSVLAAPRSLFRAHL